jgi:hypothetical protein
VESVLYSRFCDIIFVTKNTVGNGCNLNAHNFIKNSSIDLETYALYVWITVVLKWKKRRETQLMECTSFNISMTSFSHKKSSSCFVIGPTEMPRTSSKSIGWAWNFFISCMNKIKSGLWKTKGNEAGEVYFVQDFVSSQFFSKNYLQNESNLNPNMSVRNTPTKETLTLVSTISFPTSWKQAHWYATRLCTCTICDASQLIIQVLDFMNKLFQVLSSKYPALVVPWGTGDITLTSCDSSYILIGVDTQEATVS